MDPPPLNVQALCHNVERGGVRGISRKRSELQAISRTVKWAYLSIYRFIGCHLSWLYAKTGWQTQQARINFTNSFQSAGLYFVISRSSMEAGVRLNLGGGTGMARPAPLRSPSSIRGWRESLTEVEWWLGSSQACKSWAGALVGKEPRRRSNSRFWLE